MNVYETETSVVIEISGRKIVWPKNVVIEFGMNQVAWWQLAFNYDCFG